MDHKELPVNRGEKTFEEHSLDTHDLLEKLLHSRRLNFDDFWYDDMLARMDHRRKFWDDEMKRIRNDFFTLFPHNEADDAHICAPFLLPAILDSDFAVVPSFPAISNGHTNGSCPITNKTNEMKSFYDRGADGLVHYKVHFNVQDFKPEDIKVSAKGRKLHLHAKSEEKTDNSLQYREFSRTIDVPDNVDLAQLKCTITTDHVLMLDAPVKTPNYQNAIDTVKESQKPLMLPLNHARPPSPQPDRQLVTGKNGLSLINVGDHKKLHLEIPLDDQYAPDQVKISVNGKSIMVHARHEEKDENNLHYHEFRREYGIPQYIDPNSVRATTSGNTLIIEGNVVA